MPQEIKLLSGMGSPVDSAPMGQPHSALHAMRGAADVGDTGSPPTFKGERSYAAKTVILQEGTPQKDILVLEEGWAIGYRLQPDGNRRIILFYLPGDMLNPSALFHDHSRKSIQALTPIRVSVRDASGLYRFDLERQRKADDPASLIGASFQMLQERVIGLSARSGIEATAALFLNFYNRLRQRGEIKGYTFWCPITQGHIADALGLTKVHVSRTVTALREKRLLEFNRQCVELLDYDGLCQLSGVDLTPDA